MIYSNLPCHKILFEMKKDKRFYEKVVEYYFCYMKLNIYIYALNMIVIGNH